ncbi:hypothetical protein G5575_05655 [Devosia chinhatensis]|uniref:Uncharacterized protein n=1 Tax=Devosia aurantiaca TaxID=2714858 RepID=A0A6M1SWH1_9HYPH|nr:hypothetical protein [Devosia aurantiaca]
MKAIELAVDQFGQRRKETGQGLAGAGGGNQQLRGAALVGRKDVELMLAGAQLRVANQSAMTFGKDAGKVDTSDLLQLLRKTI